MRLNSNLSALVTSSQAKTGRGAQRAPVLLVCVEARVGVVKSRRVEPTRKLELIQTQMAQKPVLRAEL